MSEDQDVVLCECGNPSEPDECPFDAELNDNTTICNCCDECIHECFMSI